MLPLKVVLDRHQKIVYYNYELVLFCGPGRPNKAKFFTIFPRVYQRGLRSCILRDSATIRSVWAYL